MPEDNDEQERNQVYGLISVLFWAAFVLAWYKYAQPNWLSTALTLLAVAPMAYFTYMVASYVPRDEDESRLHGLKPVLRYIPVIKKPDGHVSFKMKMTWDLVILITYSF